MLIRIEKGHDQFKGLRWELTFHRHPGKARTHFAQVTIYNSMEEIEYDESFSGKSQAREFLRETLYNNDKEQK